MKKKKETNWFDFISFVANVVGVMIVGTFTGFGMFWFYIIMVNNVWASIFAGLTVSALTAIFLFILIIMGVNSS